MNTLHQHGSASALFDAVAARGVRLTRQRRILLDLLEQADGHLQPSDLLRLGQAQDPKMDRTTVYRTLTLLKSLGLVDELDLLHLEGHEHYYELKSRTGHAHVGCLQCGRIMEFESDAQSRLTRDIERTAGWKVGSVRIEVAAICPECQADGKSKPEASGTRIEGREASPARRQDSG